MGLRAVSHRWCCRSPPAPAGTASWAGREVCGTRGNQCGQPYCLSMPETSPCQKPPQCHGEVAWEINLRSSWLRVLQQGALSYKSKYLFFTHCRHYMVQVWSGICTYNRIINANICAHMGCATLLSTPGTWHKCPPLTKTSQELLGASSPCTSAQRQFSQ